MKQIHLSVEIIIYYYYHTLFVNSPCLIWSPSGNFFLTITSNYN